jgi:hypothetical protein
MDTHQRPDGKDLKLIHDTLMIVLKTCVFLTKNLGVKDDNASKERSSSSPVE